jgi:protein TonB
MRERVAAHPGVPEVVTVRAAGVVLPFPGRAPEVSVVDRRPTADAQPALPNALARGDRPTIVPGTLRGWLQAALILSLLLHGAAYVAFQLRFADDVERAAGAAAAAASDGAIIPVEVVVESMLPSAPAPADASASEASETEPSSSEIAGLMPPPPEPAPVVLPTREQAARLALPEEPMAPPVDARPAEMPQDPMEAVELDSTPPLPLPRKLEPVPERKREPERETRQAKKPEPEKSEPSTPSRAASPSRAAASGATGSSGGGGNADTGGRAAISSYQAQVLAHLSRHRVYPPEAQRAGLTGVARVTFSLARDGRVLSASLAGRSGEEILDQAALDMVRRAAPFPPFPAGISQSRLAFGAPIRFDLR